MTNRGMGITGSNATPEVMADQQAPVVIDGTNEMDQYARSASVAMGGDGVNCNPNLPPMVDAFSYNWLFGFRYAQSLMRDFPPMQALRRAQAYYRPMAYVLPGTGYQNIPAYGSVEWQVKMKPGTWIWGYQCRYNFQLNNATQLGPAIQIYEGTSRLPLLGQQAPLCTIFKSGLLANRSQATQVGWDNPVSYVTLLNPPRCIEGDGSVSVSVARDEFAPLVTNGSFLVLHTCEPIQ